jgi:glycosyltransferase involved in cell wall biosynthesis
MPKVSIIVPVYGVEKYIERCIRSLFNQTLDDIEYLFIDDCSPDRSIDILKQVLEEYPYRKQQVIIHRMDRNSGQAAVRKRGMLNATGEYIIHCDSDDWVDISMYEDMYNLAKKDNADVAICDFLRTDTKEFNKVEHGAHTTDKAGFLINCLFQRDHWSLCNKLFNRKVYYKEKVEYPAGALGEDMALCIQLLNACEKIAYIPKVYYFYYVNPMSITKKTTVSNCIKNYYTLKENTELVINYINERLSINQRTKAKAISYLKMVNLNTLLRVRHIPEYKIIWDKEFRLMPPSFFLNPRISLYNKVIYILSLFPFYPTKDKRITL